MQFKQASQTTILLFSAIHTIKQNPPEADPPANGFAKCSRERSGDLLRDRARMSLLKNEDQYVWPCSVAKITRKSSRLDVV